MDQKELELTLDAERQFLNVCSWITKNMDEIPNEYPEDQIIEYLQDLKEIKEAYIALRTAQTQTDEWKQADVFAARRVMDDLAGFEEE